MGIAVLLVVAVAAGPAFAGAPGSAGAAKRPRNPVSCESFVVSASDFSQAIEVAIGRLEDGADFGTLGAFINAIKSGGSGDAELAALQQAVAVVETSRDKWNKDTESNLLRCNESLKKLRKGAKGKIRSAIGKCLETSQKLTIASLGFDFLFLQENSLFTSYLGGGDAERSAFFDQLDVVQKAVDRFNFTEGICLVDGVG